MTMGDYYYLIQKLEELNTTSPQAGGPAHKEPGFKHKTLLGLTVYKL